jgi:DNA-binding CsgD family transcriptional regulator
VDIVGRAEEREAVLRFLGLVADGPRALFLTGDAGIGKTTVWNAALELARSNPYQILITRPTEAEARLPFAGLTDLLGALRDDLSVELPEPQRLAIDTALFRTSGSGSPPEPLAVSLAALALLRNAARRSPVLVAIDDVSWLDASSASVLEFALRRLDGEPIGLIATQRTSGEGQPTPATVAAVGEARLTMLEIAPLTRPDVDRLLSTKLGLDLTPRVLTAVVNASGGNPFYAIEIARALRRRGHLEADGPLPVPTSLGALVRDRLASLQPEAELATLYAASLSQPTVAMLASAIGHPAAATGLAAARAAGVIELEGDLIRFTHPLLAGEAYARHPVAQRRKVHRLLAEVVAEPEERARHLALAAPGPDEAVAAALDRAAVSARQRGAPDAAAELSEQAAALTPTHRPAAARERTLAAAHLHLLAGDLPRSRLLLETLLAALPRGLARAETLTKLAEVRLLMDDWGAAEALYRQALPIARPDARLRISVKLGLAGVGHVAFLHWRSAARHARDAMRLADELGDPDVLARCIGHFAQWEYLVRHRVRHDLMERAKELEPRLVGVRTLEHPDYDFAAILRDLGDRRAFRERIERLLARAEETGDLGSLGFLLINLAFDDLLDGNPELAERRVDEAEHVARTTGQRSVLAGARAARVRLLARRGVAGEAKAVARDALALAAETGWHLGEVTTLSELGLLELSLGNSTVAHGHLSSLIERHLPPWPEPSRHRGIIPIDVEALVALGRLDEAAALLEPWERLGRKLGRAAVIADGLRCRALILGARLELDGAIRALDEATELYERIDDPWGLAHASLIAGEVHRRMRQRAKGQRALSSAVELFERMGARVWAERARAELSRIEGRSAADGLTPTRRQVAELAAAGRTNREIGASLFMSPRTVEAHLSVVYRSLGVRSRAEVAAALRHASTVTDP